MTFRKAENGFVMELASETQGVRGIEYVARAPSDLRETANGVLEQRLSAVIEELIK
jgi:hypothetical protein